MKYIASFLFFLSSVLAFADGRVQCGSVKSQYMPSPVAYCALLPPSYDGDPARKFPVLYYLHGLGGDQSFLVTTGGWNMIDDGGVIAMAKSEGEEQKDVDWVWRGEFSEREAH